MNFDSSTGYKVSLSKLFNQPVLQLGMSTRSLPRLRRPSQILMKFSEIVVLKDATLSVELLF